MIDIIRLFTHSLMERQGQSHSQRGVGVPRKNFLATPALKLVDHGLFKRSLSIHNLRLPQRRYLPPRMVDTGYGGEDVLQCMVDTGREDVSPFVRATENSGNLQTLYNLFSNEIRDSVRGFSSL